eukprot:TRINITY_DN840_c0_g1_i3.p2 TRINITY_DN840_c0_g1~~TRINITY_DN840_c0_g1_i3.p2  ORF type:complete len:120 (-),score=35.99 TRINITY_DN840_c0_g1_i3:175-534(-)
MGKSSGKSKSAKAYSAKSAASNSKAPAGGGASAGGAASGSSSRNLIAANKALGQNFLKNPMIVQGIVDRAAIKASDVVLEIGPGTGNLTVQLLERAKKVIAVEYDKRMIREVLKRVEGR